MSKILVKTQIDTDITNKTSAKSISPLNVGDNMKAVVDLIPDATYKVYTALLEFVDSSTIISTVFENTIGNGSKDGINDIFWSYESPTQPKAVMLNGPFTNLKTLCSNSIYNTNMNLQGIRINNQECRFYSSNINTGSASISFTPFIFVEIKVYN